eukprot:435262_1
MSNIGFAGPTNRHYSKHCKNQSVKGKKLNALWSYNLPHKKKKKNKKKSKCILNQPSYSDSEQDNEFIYQQTLFDTINDSELIKLLKISDDIVRLMVLYSFGRIMRCIVCQNKVNIWNITNIDALYEELLIKQCYYFECDDAMVCMSCIDRKSGGRTKYFCNWCERLSCTKKGYDVRCHECNNFACQRDFVESPDTCGLCFSFTENCYTYYNPAASVIELLIKQGLLPKAYLCYDYPDSYYRYKEGYHKWFSDETYIEEMNETHSKYIYSIQQKSLMLK